MFGHEADDVVVRRLTRVLVAVGLVGLASVAALDGAVWHRGVLAEGWPVASPAYLLRSVIIAFFTLSVVLGLIGGRRPTFALDEGHEHPYERRCALAALVLATAVLYVFERKPAAFHDLSLEDGPVEWGSALLFFACSLVFVLGYAVARKSTTFPRFTNLALLALAAGCFFLAMEEISWFQRVLDVKTPEMFEHNLKHEINVHNFATNDVENVYYFGSFLFLVVLPFLRHLFPVFRGNRFFDLFVPRVFIGLIATIAFAYSFDMWDIVLTQVSFVGSVLILLAFAVFGRGDGTRPVVFTALAVVIGTQVVFLLNGMKFVRIYDVTEYREFFIPLTMFVYSLDLYARLRRKRMGWGSGLEIRAAELPPDDRARKPDRETVPS